VAAPISPEAGPTTGARYALAVRYCVVVASEASLLRQGIAVEATRRLGRAFEVHAGTEMTSQPGRQISTGAASLSDLPFRIGARALFASAGLTLGVGPSAGAHVANPDQCRGHYDDPCPWVAAQHRDQADHDEPSTEQCRGQVPQAGA
jgi:hypothetical protein